MRKSLDLQWGRKWWWLRRSIQGKGSKSARICGWGWWCWWGSGWRWGFSLGDTVLSISDLLTPTFCCKNAVSRKSNDKSAHIMWVTCRLFNIIMLTCHRASICSSIIKSPYHKSLLKVAKLYEFWDISIINSQLLVNCFILPFMFKVLFVFTLSLSSIFLLSLSSIFGVPLCQMSRLNPFVSMYLVSKTSQELRMLSRSLSVY